MIRRLVPLVLVLGLVPSHAPIRDEVALAIRWRGLTSSRAINPLFARPGEAVRIDVTGSGPFTFAAERGAVRPVTPGAWVWTATAPNGPARLVVRNALGDSIVIQALVGVPVGEIRNGRLRGYRIDAYPPGDGSLRRPAPPRAFVEVTPELRALRISPRLRLGQFLCKQESGWPKFVVLDERLILALEDLADGLAQRGMASTLTVISGYRTPFYNAGLGNVRSSRHVYGQAADVYIDVRPQDGIMDDLNGDGVTNRRDAVRLAGLVDAILGGSGREFVGGIGLYGATAAHGPFVHVDVRGYRARW